MPRWPCWRSHSLKLALLGLSIAFSFAIIDAKAEDLNADLKEIQSPSFLEKLRKSEFYKYVGKGNFPNFSYGVIKNYKKFKTHGKGSWFLVTEDGQYSKLHSCWGSFCSAKHDTPEKLIDRCESHFGQKCYVLALEENYDLYYKLEDFRGKIVWDFQAKPESQTVVKADPSLPSHALEIVKPPSAVLPTHSSNVRGDGKYYAEDKNEYDVVWKLYLEMANNEVSARVEYNMDHRISMGSGTHGGDVGCDSTKLDTEGEFELWCRGRKLSGNLKELSLWSRDNPHAASRRGGAEFKLIKMSELEKYNRFKAENKDIYKTSAYIDAKNNLEILERARKVAEARRKAKAQKQLEAEAAKAEKKRQAELARKKAETKKRRKAEEKERKRLAQIARRKAEEKRSADFQTGLDAYDKGDYATALHIWKPLANQGLAEAQYFMGLMYDKGKGVPKDVKLAVKWYTLAAKQGDVDAQYSLGGMYDFGQGVPEDDKEAMKWYRLAAEQGDTDAQKELEILQRLQRKSVDP